MELFDKYLSSVSSAVSGQAIITLDTFTSFLLSSDNSVLMDQHKDTWHDMTRPLPEYFISSSHNTYLVGHQLVGDSTIEGYIRALLCSCRSVERMSFASVIHFALPHLTCQWIYTMAKSNQ